MTITCDKVSFVVMVMNNPLADHTVNLQANDDYNCIYSMNHDYNNTAFLLRLSVNHSEKALIMALKKMESGFKPFASTLERREGMELKRF
ncbi:hypothetical protein Ccrd_009985, partial [Cynara cardunculus var. scolymus]